MLIVYEYYGGTGSFLQNVLYTKLSRHINLEIFVYGNNREFHRHYLDLVSEWGGGGEEFVPL